MASSNKWGDSNITASPGSQGAGGGNATFGGTNNIDNSTRDQSQATATAQTANAPVMNAGEGSQLTYNGSDFGAIAAAESVFGQALTLANTQASASQTTARLAIGQAGQTVADQGSAALSMITGPLKWVVGALVAGFVLWKLFGKD